MNAMFKCTRMANECYVQMHENGLMDAMFKCTRMANGCYVQMHENG